MPSSRARHPSPLAFFLRWSLCWSFCCGLFCAHARAQPLGDTIVVPYGALEAGADDDAARVTLDLADRLESTLRDASLPLTSLHDARDRFTARSRPPQVPTESDLDVLARAAAEATEHVAFGRTSAAQKSVREVLVRAERALESLNRETATARRILDACLSLVRSTLQTGRRDIALDQATLCRRLVPDLVPAETTHPASVIGVLAEADNLLRRMRIGHLFVRSKPSSGCSVYLNGRHLGMSPFRIDRAAAGEYRVQVECGGSRGRVHVVQLGDAPVELSVDTQFDAAVASDPRLVLRYASDAEARAKRTAHAVLLGRAVGVDDVILLGVGEGVAELLRVHVTQRRVVGRALVPLPAGGDEAIAAELRHAIERLIEGRRDALPDAGASSASAERAEPPVPLRPELPLPPADTSPLDAAIPERTAAAIAAPTAEAAQDHAPAPPPRATTPGTTGLLQRRLGIGLLVPAVGLFAIGVASEARARALQNEQVRLLPDTRDAMHSEQERAAVWRRLHDLQAPFERYRALRWVGLAGAALGTASVALLVRPRRVLPWWSYAVGALGLGFVGYGAYEIAARRQCALRVLESGECRQHRDSAGRGALLMGAGAPLIAVPVAQRTKAAFGAATLVPAGSFREFQLAFRIAR